MSRSENLDRLENDVSEVTSLLRNDVERVIERGEKIETLQDRSEDLEHGSINFKRQSVRLRKKMCWQNCRLNCIIAIVVFLIIAAIVTIVLVETKPWESHSNKPNNTLTLPDHPSFR